MEQTARRRGRPKSVSADPQGTAIQSLDRALDVLEVLARHEGITLTELSAALDQSPSTMYRVLTTLEQRHYVESNGEKQEWFIGPETFTLGSAFLRRANILERSRTTMRELMSRTGETSNLGIERDGDVFFVSQIETHETIRAFFAPGTRAPLHASGIGKALLSAFPKERVDAYLRTATFTRFTDNTITSTTQLQDALAEARRRRYAFDDEERTIGMRCVASPIFNAHGEAVAGISVSGPTIRLPEKRVREIGQLVADAAAEISRQLGLPAQNPSK